MFVLFSVCQKQSDSGNIVKLPRRKFTSSGLRCRVDWWAPTNWYGGVSQETWILISRAVRTPNTVLVYILPISLSLF